MYIQVILPFSDDDKDVEYQRYKVAEAYVAQLSNQGHVVACPITNMYHVALNHDLPTDYSFWRKYSLTIMKNGIEEVHVLMLDGWRDSVGTTDEIENAQLLGLPIVWKTKEEILGSFVMDKINSGELD